MSNRKGFYYGGKQAFSLFLGGTILAWIGLYCLYVFLVEGLTPWIEIKDSFGLMIIFIFVISCAIGGIWCLIVGIKLLYCVSIHSVILEVDDEGFVNYERNIRLKWSDIENIQLRNTFNKKELGVVVKDSNILKGQVNIFALRLFELNKSKGLDLFSAGYVKGGVQALYQTIYPLYKQSV